MALACPICFEQYIAVVGARRPRLLPRCGHDFCTGCIARLSAAATPTCPQCRVGLFPPPRKSANAPDEYLLWPVMRCAFQLDTRLDFSGAAASELSEILRQRALSSLPTELIEFELCARRAGGLGAPGLGIAAGAAAATAGAAAADSAEAPGCGAPGCPRPGLGRAGLAPPSREALRALAIAQLNSGQIAAAGLTVMQLLAAGGDSALLAAAAPPAATTAVPAGKQGTLGAPEDAPLAAPADGAASHSLGRGGVAAAELLQARQMQPTADAASTAVPQVAPLTATRAPPLRTVSFPPLRDSLHLWRKRGHIGILPYFILLLICAGLELAGLAAALVAAVLARLWRQTRTAGREQVLQIMMILNGLPLLFFSVYIFWNPRFVWNFMQRL